MRVYQLNNYSEEVISHAFAKTSRSSGSFDEMAAGLNEEKSAIFHEKWVLDYAHQSVAEHSVGHIAIEGLTRPVLELIESCRLASYTEQSTRYQSLKRDAVYFDESWHTNFKQDYNQVMNLLFGLYEELMKISPDKNVSYDVARFALPLGATANLGMTINMRALRRTICKLLASELPEAQTAAQELIKVGMEVAPTLLKYLNPCNFIKKSENISTQKLNKSKPIATPIDVKLKKSYVNLTDILQKLAVSCGGSFEETISFHDYTQLMDSLERHDSISRAFEYGYLEFLITSDYGAYYDMKRHRIATLIPEKGCSLNILRPSQLKDESNYFTKRYNAVMAQVKEIVARHLSNPEHIYMVPNGAQKRYSMLMNPREWAEISILRGFNLKGHPTYRSVGLKMYDVVIKKYPFLDFIAKHRQDTFDGDSIIEGYKII
jgi:thymidylate synthase ThyX